MKTYGPAWLGMGKFFPYPLRSSRISFCLNPFGWWLKPSFTRKKDLTEAAKRDGATIWWFRWLFLQVSYSRQNLEILFLNNLHLDFEYLLVVFAYFYTPTKSTSILSSLKKVLAQLSRKINKF